MWKQALAKVLNEGVVANGGGKIIRPCSYIPAIGFHQGQVMLV